MEKRFFIKLDHLKPYNSIILNTIFIWLILFYHFCISSQLIQLFYANSIDIMFISTKTKNNADFLLLKVHSYQ